jgi:hypothetical protein
VNIVFTLKNGRQIVAKDVDKFNYEKSTTTGKLATYEILWERGATVDRPLYIDIDEIVAIERSGV